MSGARAEGHAVDVPFECHDDLHSRRYDGRNTWPSRALLLRSINNATLTINNNTKPASPRVIAAGLRCAGRVGPGWPDDTRCEAGVVGAAAARSTAEARSNCASSVVRRSVGRRGATLRSASGTFSTGSFSIMSSSSSAPVSAGPVGDSGLFTTAEDLSKLATLWLCRGKRQGKRFFSEEIWQAFTTKGIVWHVGNAGDIVPASLSPRTCSHIGWTGQTLIIDPERAMYIIVLTNRTHPAVHASKEDGDRARHRIAEAVVRALFATSG